MRVRSLSSPVRKAQALKVTIVIGICSDESEFIDPCNGSDLSVDKRRGKAKQLQPRAFRSMPLGSGCVVRENWQGGPHDII